MTLHRPLCAYCVVAQEGKKRYHYDCTFGAKVQTRRCCIDRTRGQPRQVCTRVLIAPCIPHSTAPRPISAMHPIPALPRLPMLRTKEMPRCLAVQQSANLRRTRCPCHQVSPERVQSARPRCCVAVRRLPALSVRSAHSDVAAIRSNAPRVGPAAAVKALVVCFRC